MKAANSNFSYQIVGLLWQDFFFFFSKGTLDVASWIGDLWKATFSQIGALAISENWAPLRIYHMRSMQPSLGVPINSLFQSIPSTLLPSGCTNSMKIENQAVCKWFIMFWGDGGFIFLKKGMIKFRKTLLKGFLPNPGIGQAVLGDGLSSGCAWVWQSCCSSPKNSWSCVFGGWSCFFFSLQEISENLECWFYPLFLWNLQQLWVPALPCQLAEGIRTQCGSWFIIPLAIPCLHLQELQSNTLHKAVKSQNYHQLGGWKLSLLKKQWAEEQLKGIAGQRTGYQGHLPAQPDFPTQKGALLLAKTFGVGVSLNFNSFADCFLCLDKDMAFIASGKANVWAWWGGKRTIPSDGGEKWSGTRLGNQPLLGEEKNLCREMQWINWQRDFFFIFF